MCSDLGSPDGHSVHPRIPILAIFVITLHHALSCLMKNKYKVLPLIGNKYRQFCTSLVQSLYYVPDSYFRSEGVIFIL
jgi:hypothetical protein